MGNKHNNTKPAPTPDTLGKRADEGEADHSDDNDSFGSHSNHSSEGDVQGKIERLRDELAQQAAKPPPESATPKTPPPPQQQVDSQACAMSSSQRPRKGSDEDLFWDDEVPATHNNLMKLTESKKSAKSKRQQENEWNNKKESILQYFSRVSGYDYLLIDVQRIILKYCGFNFVWRWDLRDIHDALALYDGCRKVVCNAGPSSKIIVGRERVFPFNSTSTEETFTFKIHQSNFKLKCGICAVSVGQYYWFSGIEKSAKIDTSGMSQMKQDMLGSIFGHLPSQKREEKTFSPLRAGDTVVIRLWRTNRNAKTCTMERKYNNGNWEIMQANVRVPCVAAADLYSIGDAISFVQN